MAALRASPCPTSCLQASVSSLPSPVARLLHIYMTVRTVRRGRVGVTVFAWGQSLQRDCVKFMTFYAFYLEENQTQNEFLSLSLSSSSCRLACFRPRPFLDKQNRLTDRQTGRRTKGEREEAGCHGAFLRDLQVVA